MKGLLPHVLNPSSSTAAFQVSMAWNKRVSSGSIHRTGTLISCFSRVDTSTSVSSPLMPSAPAASTASLASFQAEGSLCLFSSATVCRLLTFWAKMSNMTYLLDDAAYRLSPGSSTCGRILGWASRTRSHDSLCFPETSDNLFDKFRQFKPGLVVFDFARSEQLLCVFGKKGYCVHIPLTGGS